MNEVLESNAQHAVYEALKVNTASFRNFNIGCLTYFFLSTAIALVFVDKLLTGQIIFLLFFIIFGVANVVFHVVSHLTQANWVKARLQGVYIPYGIVVSLLIASIILFLGVLDDMNNKTNNIHPPAEKDLLVTQTYVIFFFVIYVFGPLFQGISFCAYAMELGLYLDEKPVESEQ